MDGRVCAGCDLSAALSIDSIPEKRDKTWLLKRLKKGGHADRAAQFRNRLPTPDGDIVADRFDAGVRLGDAIDKDMIAVPIGPQLRMAIAASPAYFETHPIPKTPRDLLKHSCINMRMQTAGGLYVWHFERRGQPLNVQVDGQLIFNTSPSMVDAAVAGLGIATQPEEEFAPHIEEGRLVRVLEDWSPAFPGYYLYYPSRRQPSPAFSLVLNALRVAPPPGPKRR